MKALCSLAALLVLAGCGSNAENVCELVGDCSQAGSSDWIEACRSGAEALKTECAQAGCSDQYSAYFSCAYAKYDCPKNVATFKGCEGARAQLDGCLAKAPERTSCTQLQNAVSACPGADAGIAPPACSAQRSCEARCLLASEQNVCLPQTPELAAFTDCVKSCL